MGKGNPALGRSLQEVDMNRNHRIGFSWLAVVLCMALLMTGMPFAPAYAKSKSKDKKETY